MPFPFFELTMRALRSIDLWPTHKAKRGLCGSIHGSLLSTRDPWFLKNGHKAKQWMGFPLSSFSIYVFKIRFQMSYHTLLDLFSTRQITFTEFQLLINPSFFSCVVKSFAFLQTTHPSPCRTHLGQFYIRLLWGALENTCEAANDFFNFCWESS